MKLSILVRFFIIQFSIWALLACAENQNVNNENLTESAEDSLFVDVPEDAETQELNLQVQANLEVQRHRLVSVNLNPIEKLAQEKATQTFLKAHKPQSLRLSLFQDLSLVMEVSDVEKIADGNVIVTGKVMNEADSKVTLVSRDGYLAGHIHYKERHYEIAHASETYQVIREVEALHESYCGTNEHDAEAEFAEDAEEQTEGGFGLFAEASNTIDMAVMYTPSALTAAGSKRAMEAGIQLAAADTNTAFKEGEVAAHKVRVVAIVATNDRDTGNIETDLSSFKSKTDRRWDNIHTLRSQYGADQVTLVIGGSSTTAGMGYVGGGASRAFTVVRYQAFRNQTFAHELGHNLGLAHSDGLEFSGKFRTIMAYGSTPRIARYSNPNSTYQGIKIGDSRHNSVAKILRTIPKFSRHYATKVR